MSDHATTREKIEQQYGKIAEAVHDLDHNWIMTSGAGCGKTYQMVERYVAIIDQGFEVSSIVAVTFTRKAAAELKDRVREKCRARAAAPDLSAEERKRWEQAARQLAMAPVSTIHGLCGRLLRENAIAAGIDPRFGVVEETQRELLLREAVRETLLERLHDGVETARMCVERWGLERAGEVIRGLIDDRESIADLLADPPGAEELLARWEDEFERVYGPLLEELTSCEHWDEASRCLLAVEPCTRDDRAAERHREARAVHEIVTDETQPLSVRATAFGECISLGHKGHVGRKDNWSDRPEDHQTIKDGLYALGELRDACKEDKISFPDGEEGAPARLGAAVVREASAAAEAYDAAKREEAVLDFADLQIRARDLLAEHPDVLDRVRRRYQHVLVDEFQDTNDLQKDIVWRLAGGDPETGAPPPDGGLFVVGDAKQSIYGFRNADVTVFNRTARDFLEEETAGPIPLEATRRSRPRLAAFLNDLFARPEVMGSDADEDYEACYEPVAAYREPHEMPAEARLILIPKEDLAEEPDEGEEQQKVPIRDARQREAEVLAERIREMVESGEPRVWDKEDQCARPPEYGDFGMLFQATTDIGVYEYAFRRAGVPFYTVAGRGFYNRQEIRDCLSMLQVVENTSNEVALAGVLRSPMFGLSDDTLLFLTREEEPLIVSLKAAAGGCHEQQAHFDEEQLRRIRVAHETIDRLREIRDRVGLSELVERMLAETGLGAVELTQFSGRQSAANLTKLTDLARSFEGRGAFSLREFIGYLSDLVVQEPREGLADVYEEGEDVVKLMTVHAAKGLEWPIVVVPDLGRSLRGSGGTVQVSSRLGVVPRVEAEDGRTSWGAVGEIVRDEQREREEAERRRLLYVALTRARDMLLLSSALEFAGEGEDRRLSAGYWLTWLAEGLGLDCTSLEDAETLGGEDWTVDIELPGPNGEQSEGRWPGEGRSDPGVLTHAVAGEAEALPERVQPVTAASLPHEHLSVTALQCYRRCPREFYLRHVHGLAEEFRGGQWLHGLSGARRGSIAHRVLEVVGRSGLEAGAVEDALEQVAHLEGIASEAFADERERIEAGVRWLVEDARVAGEPLYADWIAGAQRLRAEAQFVAPLAGTRIEGTIDALIEAPDGKLRVLDYKTGRSDSDRIDAYRFQIGLYCAAVRENSGRIPADAALVLLDQQALEWLDPAVEAEAAVTAARNVMKGITEGAFGRSEACRPGDCRLAYACELT